MDDQNIRLNADGSFDWAEMIAGGEDVPAEGIWADEVYSPDANPPEKSKKTPLEEFTAFAEAAGPPWLTPAMDVIAEHNANCKAWERLIQDTKTRERRMAQIRTWPREKLLRALGYCESMMRDVYHESGGGQAPTQSDAMKN